MYIVISLSCVGFFNLMFLCFFLSKLFAVHTWLITTGLTFYEHIKKKYFTFLDIRPYSQGFCNNIYDRLFDKIPESRLSEKYNNNQQKNKENIQNKENNDNNENDNNEINNEDNENNKNNYNIDETGNKNDERQFTYENYNNINNNEDNQNNIENEEEENKDKNEDNNKYNNKMDETRSLKINNNLKINEITIENKEEDNTNNNNNEYNNEDKKKSFNDNDLVETNRNP